MWTRGAGPIWTTLHPPSARPDDPPWSGATVRRHTDGFERAGYCPDVDRCISREASAMYGFTTTLTGISFAHLTGRVAPARVV